jgi:exodeoxyribonuclease-3
MRVITANVNGIRAAAKKGFFEWLATTDADFVCLQETRAHLYQLTAPFFHPPGYHVYYLDAEKAGYSGVAIYSKIKPDEVITTLGFPLADTEARYLEVKIGKLSVISLYLPSGTSSESRQAQKYLFMEKYLPILKKQLHSTRSYIICGDWNVAHQKIDLKNWRGNQKSSGFLPEERAWLDKVFALGWVDGFRKLNQEPDQYTWWSNRGKAYENNAGWRIDYQIITPDLAEKLQSVSIFKTLRFSDHAPVMMDYDWP